MGKALQSSSRWKRGEVPSVHDIEINTQYKRFLKSDISDIEDLAPGTGGVLNKGLLQNASAVFKDEHGGFHGYSVI